MKRQAPIITFVCTANVCRSPMAAALFKHALNAMPEPYNQIEVISAGISAFPNQPVTGNSYEAMKHVGVDISHHKSQILTQEILDNSFAVFVMTDSHKSLIEMSFDKVPENLFLMREFIQKTSDRQIPDPFGESLPVYTACRDSMVEAIPSLVEFVKEKYPVGELTKQ